MCLIITFAAAIVSTLIYIFKKIRKFDILVFMYWGAAIMWSVDSIFSAANHEGFFNISLNDTYLGLVVVLAGLVIWGIIYLASKLKAKKTSDT